MAGDNCEGTLWSGGALHLGGGGTTGNLVKRQGRPWQPGPILLTQPAIGHPGVTGAAVGIKNLPQHRWRLWLHWDMGLHVRLAWWGPWLGRAGLWRAGDQPCCGIARPGADCPGGADMGSWAVGRVEGALEERDRETQAPGPCHIYIYNNYNAVNLCNIC